MARVIPGNAPINLLGYGTVVNWGPGTVYYGDDQFVTSSTADGQLLMGQMVAVNGAMWFGADTTGAEVGIINSGYGGNPVTAIAGTDASDAGLIAWVYDAALATAASVPVAGTMYLVRIPARAGAPWNRIVMTISTAGTGATPLANCFMGVYDMSGVRRGVSADQAGAWATGGTKAAAMVPDAGPGLAISTGDQWAYAAFVVGQQATTPLQFFRSGSSASPGQLLLTVATQPPARFLSKTGFAGGLPATIDYSTCSPTSFLWWMGVAA